MTRLSLRLYWCLLAFTLSTHAHAYSLGGGGTGIFAQIGNFLQEIVNFLGGTGTMFVVFLSFAGAITMWVLIPKQAGAAVAWAFRAACGAIALFAMATLVTWIQGF